jgi:hypothetical protein
MTIESSTKTTGGDARLSGGIRLYTPHDWGGCMVLTV